MIRFRLLGAVSITSADGHELRSILAQPKRVALLAYLAVTSARGYQTRDRLLGIFWPDLDEEHARGALNSALYQLRRSLGAEALLSRGAELRINDQLLACDATEFERLAAEGRHAEALELYQGDLLPGWYLDDAREFELWLSQERARLQGLALGCARALARAAAAPGEAVPWLRRAAALAPDDETVLRELLAALDGSGDRAGALRCYEQFARRIGEELGSQPRAETRALVEAIRARDDAAAPVSPPPAPASRAAATPPAISTSPSPAPAPAAATPPAAPAAPERARSFAALASPPRTKPIRRRRRGLLWAVVTASVVVAVSVTALLAARRRSDTAPRVLVARFANQTGQVALRPIGEMSADWIAQGVARAGFVEVADGTVLGEGTPGANAWGVTDWMAAARRLRARYLLGGSYYLQNGRVQLDARLYDVEGGKIISVFDPVSAAPDSVLTAIDTLQDRAITAVAMAVASHWRYPAEGSPPRYEAYLEYIQGNQAVKRRDYPAALDHLRHAVALDSGFARAALGAALTAATMGQTLASDSFFKLAGRRPERLTPVDRLLYAYLEAGRRGDVEAQRRLAQEGARRAPESEWTYALALAALGAGRARETVRVLEAMRPDAPPVGGVYMYWVTLGMAHHALGEHREELAGAQRGLEQYPGNTAIFAARARALAALGRVDELRRDLADMPVPPWGPGTWMPGTVLAIAAAELDAHGQPAAAAEARRRVVAWYRSLPPERRDPEAPLFGLTWVLYYAQAWPELEARAAGLARAQPEDARWLALLGAAAAHRGDRAAARQADQRLAALTAEELRIRSGVSRGDVLRPLWRARIAGLLGQPELALALLRQAAAAGGDFDLYYHVDPAFAALRNRPEFRRLITPRD